MKKIEVVAAVIEKDNKIFCAQRNSEGALGGKWEFPGGKIESGEGREEALIRELREELEIDVEIKKHVMTVEHQYPNFFIVMHAFQCSIKCGEIMLKEHQDSCWLKREELDQLDWAEADIPIYKKIQEVFEVKYD